jgi:hypothetical protein
MFATSSAIDAPSQLLYKSDRIHANLKTFLKKHLHAIKNSNEKEVEYQRENQLTYGFAEMPAIQAVCLTTEAENKDEMILEKVFARDSIREGNRLEKGGFDMKSHLKSEKRKMNSAFKANIFSHKST